MLKAFSGVGSHANAFKGFKSIKLLKGIAKISPFLDYFAIAYDVAVGIVDNKEEEVSDINKYIEDFLLDVYIDAAPIAIQSIVSYAIVGTAFGGPVGTVVGVIVGVLSFVFLDCIKYGKDKKTGRKILKEGVYESAPTIGEAAALNASHFQLGETLIMGAR